MIFEGLRWIIGRGVLAYEKMTAPEPPVYSLEQQAAIDAQTQGLALYEFKACPFCMKVRQEFRRKGLNIELRDARRNPAWGDELREDGGKYQTPCLKITSGNGQVEWLYESNDIIDWLENNIVIEARQG
jgi:glutaredoxin